MGKKRLFAGFPAREGPPAPPERAPRAALAAAFFRKGGSAVHVTSGIHLRVLGTEYLAVPSGPAAARFNGLIMLNETGAFLLRALETETDRESLLRQLSDSYDAPEELLRKDLEDFLARMRELGLLEEDGHE